MRIKSTAFVVLSLLISTSPWANEEINLPVIENAHVFYQDTEAMPYVVNYFTKASKDDVIGYYQNQLGNVSSQEMKRGRLTLIFNDEKTQFRVIISEQNNQRQVDLIATEQTL